MSAALHTLSLPQHPEVEAAEALLLQEEAEGEEPPPPPPPLSREERIAAAVTSLQSLTNGQHVLGTVVWANSKGARVLLPDYPGVAG